MINFGGLDSGCKEESRGIVYGMEEQSLESLAGSSNVELIIEPRAATAICTSDQWIFLAKGTALEVYDASGLTELVPLSPSKGISHFPFIVELLVNLRDGFSVLAMGSDGGRHWGVVKVVQTGMGYFNFSISVGTSDRPLLDPLPPSYASPLPFPFLNSIAIPQNQGVQKRERRAMLAGCLVNGILSVIAIDVMSVSTTPTLSRSDGIIQDKEENNSHDSSEYKLQLNLPQQLVQVRWVSHNNLLGKIPLQQKSACDSNRNPNSTSANTSAWISNSGELPIATSCHISASCWLSDGTLAVLMSRVDTPYSTVWPTHIFTYFVDDRNGGSLWMGPWRADFVHPQTIIASSSRVSNCGSEGNDANWDALLLAVSPREVAIYGTSGCLCTIPWQEHMSPIALTYSVTSSSFIIYTSNGDFHECMYTEETQHKCGTLKLTTNMLKANEFELQHEDTSPAEPIWLLTAIPRRVNTMTGSDESKNNNCCFSLAGVCDDSIHRGKAKRTVLKEEGTHCSVASNYWLLVGGRRRLCTAFSLCKRSNSPKMCIKTQVPQSLIPALCAIRIDGAKDSGLKLLIAGKDHLSLACRGVMMSILAQGDTGLDGGNLRLLSTTVVDSNAGCYDLLVFSDSSRGVTHLVGIMNEMVEPIELEIEGTTTPKESFIHSESTIHLSYTGEWILQVTQHQVVSVHQRQCLGGDVQAGQSLLSTLHWERKGQWKPSFSSSRRILIDHATSPVGAFWPSKASRNSSIIIICTSMPDISVLTVGEQGRLNCNVCRRLDGAVAALTSFWSSTGSNSHTSPNYINSKLLIAYSLWDTNIIQILEMDGNDSDERNLKQITTLRLHDQIRSLLFCSLCLVAGMVDGQVCIYSLNECLSEPGHNPRPWKQKEVGSGPIFLHRMEVWKGLTTAMINTKDKILIDGNAEGNMILEVWEEEVNHSGEASLQISIVPVMCNSRRSKTKSHTNLSVLSCGEAFAWAERHHHHHSDISDSALLNQNTNTYFTVVDEDAEKSCYQNNSDNYFTSSCCWRLYIGTLTLDDDLRANDVPQVENTGSLILTAPPNYQQCCYVTRTAKLKKCCASVERILLVPACQCIVVAIRDTCGWYIVTYDDIFLNQTSYSPTAIEGEITSLLLSELPPAMNKTIKDHNREANQIADTTALISVILLTKTCEEKSGEVSCEHRTTPTERAANDLPMDESSVILVLQLSVYKDRGSSLHPCASLSLPGKGCYCACSLNDWWIALGVDNCITLSSLVTLHDQRVAKVGWRSPSESGRLRWRLEEIYSIDCESIPNGEQNELGIIPQGCVTALASTRQKGKTGGFLAVAFLLNGVTLYGHDIESPKLFALVTWKDSAVPITCLGISWVLGSISIAVPQESGIVICSAHVVGCDGAQKRDEGNLELDYSYHHDASLSQSFLPQLSGPLLAVAHLKFPSGFVPCCLVLNTIEKDGYLSSHNVFTVCAASGAVYEAIHNVSVRTKLHY